MDDSEAPTVFEKSRHGITGGLARRMRLLSHLSAGGVLAIGALALAGWAVDAPRLKSVLVGGISMKPNAAIGLIFAGASLLLRGRDDPPWRRAAATTFAAIAALIGALTMFELATAHDLGIDELLYREPAGARAAAALGRMGLVAALSLFGSGAALILLGARHRIARAIAQVLAAAMSLLVLLPVVGYTDGGEALYGTVPFGIAAHTALALAMLNAGILLSSPTEFLVAVVSSPYSGGIMARRLLPIALALPLGAGSLVLLGERARLFGASTTLSLLAVCVIALFSATIWHNARALNQLEEMRTHSSPRYRTSCGRRST